MQQPMDTIESSHPVSIELEGKTYKGNYWVAGKILTVSTCKGGKSRQVGASPIVLAEQLLADLARAGKA